MNPDNTIEYNSLSWVKAQLDDVLSDAQSNLSEYIENKTDANLENCIEHLQLIYGTLQMVEVYGASMLAEEMQHTTAALLQGDIERVEDAYDVLMRAMLQLPDYLEGIQAGKKDAPITLMPLINDLRAVRKEALLTESVLFSPDIENVKLTYGAEVTAPGKLQGEVKRLRTHYQLGLLDYIHNKKERPGLQRIKAVLNALKKASSNAEVRHLWMVVGALVEGLMKQGIDTNLTIKTLLAAVDRQLKLVLDVGEEEFGKQYSKELIKNALYYVGLCTVDSKSISAVKDAYRLPDLMHHETEEPGAAVGGLNIDLFNTVSKGITEDLEQVKDVLELFMLSTEQDLEQLVPVADQLGKIADTYGMLGMGATRQSIMEQRVVLESIIKGDTKISEQVISGIAFELLNAESELKDYIASRSGFIDMNRDADNLTVPAAEYREVIFTVVSEALKNFSEAKEAILSCVSETGGRQQLDVILGRLEEVRGVSMMLNLDRVGSQVGKLQDFIRVALLNNNHQLDNDEQDTVADVVTSVEYFLEALSEGRPGVEQGLNAGDEAAVKLEKITRSYGDSVQQAPAEDMQAVSDEGRSETTDKKKQKISKSKAKAVVAETIAPEDIGQYAVISEDADEEIVEIFIEEAVEVLAQLHNYLAQWKDDTEDEEARAVIRRSFHTLKGSGRLLGAELIGEFSWKFENVLNRVIDNKINVSETLFHALDEALAVLPQLIEQIKGNREPVDNIAQLMLVADELADGGEVSLAGSPELDINELDTDNNISLEELEIETNDNTGDGSVEEELISLETEAIVDDRFDIELPGDGVIDAGNGSDISHEYEIVIDEDEGDVAGVPGDVLDIDPMLLKIYHDESIGHIESVRQQLDECESSGRVLQADKKLMRAFHTLYGSARTADVEPIADLSGAAERYIKARQESTDENIPDNVVDVLREIEQAITAMLAKVSDAKLPASNKILQEKINKIVQQEIQAQLQKSWQDNTATVGLVDTTENDGQEPGVSDDISIDIIDLSADDASDDIAHEDTEAVDTNSEEIEVLTEAEVQEVAEQAVQMPYGDIDDELIDIFLEEAEELLESCEDTLNEIKSTPNSTEHIHQLQRNMHTLKGGARMADLTPVGDLTHTIESLVVMVNDKKVDVNKALFDLLHESLDALTTMLARVKQRQPLSTVSNLNNRIKMLMHGEVEEKRAVERFDVELSELELADDKNFENIEIADMLPVGKDESDVGLELTGDFNRRKEDRNKERPHWGERVTDVNYKDSQEQVRVRSDLLNNLVNCAGEVSIYHARMGKQISDFSFNLSELTQTVVRLKEQLRNLEIETEIQIRSGYEKDADNYDDSFDPLEMDQYSTLQQLTRSLSETAGDVDSINGILNEITRDSETLLLQESRISSDLQEGLMRTRMVRFGGLSSRLRRIVRQVARELGKEVELEIVGESSEVDRTVLDRVIAPLEHMLRNAVAHGIEAPEARKALGKNETGKIIIEVDRQGAEVVINVKDDGAGIDVDKIREKVIKQDLIKEDSELSDRDILQFILKSGFSTADKVTQVAGRGVGMDVVESEIKQLGGVLYIDTEQGKGTEFNIRLPLTLAINQALLVSAADDVFAVPLASIEGVVRITGLELQRFYDSDNDHYEFNDVEYELKHLGGLLTGDQPDYTRQLQLFPVLLVHVGDQHFALHVEDLIGRREIVVKPVGMQIGAVHGIAGATILADGRVVLILEMSALVAAESLFKPRAQIEVQVPVVVDKKTIMVVDDSITIRKVTERILRRYGIEVVLAKDGVDATNKLQEQTPDLMLLDIEMPRMDGFEVASYVRNDERLKNIPIIMITSRTGAKHKEKAMDIGVNQYLGKPFQEDDLVNNINEILHTSY